MAIYTDTKIAQGPFLFISGQTPSQDGATPEARKSKQPSF